MTRNDELDRNLFDYDDQTFVPFTNDLQFRFLIVNANGGAELGETIIDAADANNPAEELFIKVFRTASSEVRSTNWATGSSQAN